jgi:peroxiredoxin (alkyl hydroperoxide reductase subunit C)
MAIIEPGTPAPDFALATYEGDPFTRSDLEGRGTFLVFYPHAFSPVCTDQLSVYTEVLDELREAGLDAIYGVSCDSVWAQQAFREKLGTDIEQLSDWEPKGAACRAFGVLHPGGFPERALVLVGPDAVVRWSFVADSPGDLPGANLLFDALG